MSYSVGIGMPIQSTENTECVWTSYATRIFHLGGWLTLMLHVTYVGFYSLCYINHVISMTVTYQCSNRISTHTNITTCSMILSIYISVSSLPGFFLISSQTS